ncbi:MAG: 4Fe-4S dicluster domain-containing protein [Erysipelotrichales bacterium]|nr:4Fe-4S dicluster domain-containing protein [Erysipelotrichales bacterium]
MIRNDTGIVGFKHEVLEEVARLAWKGELTPGAKDELVYKLIPGPKAMWRCCVYKEREIVRQRIKLACAEAPDGRHAKSDNVIQVIEAACEECPLSSYVVTDNCRLCIGKACLNSCRFGAITIGANRSYIDPSKCRECGMCADACPYGAIAHLIRPCKKVCPVGAITYDEYGVCEIDDSKCINCGTCIHSCPFGAISSKTYLVQIIDAILKGKEVYAMCAPATEGQFGPDISMASIRKALKAIGFADMIEVGLGADMTAAYEAAEWSEARKEGKKMTTSCCPAFIQLLRKHFPKQFAENMSQVVSPMCAVSRYIKYTHPGAVTVFIGPCIAKKTEAVDPSVPDNADYAITYGEFTSLLASKDVELEPMPDDVQEASVFGKRFASGGGVAAAVMEVMKERGEDTSDIKLRKAAGGMDCRTALQLLKLGRLPEDFIEGMICPEGCVGGPSRHVAVKELTKARETLLSKADSRNILDNLKNYPMGEFSMKRNNE